MVSTQYTSPIITAVPIAPLEAPKTPTTTSSFRIPSNTSQDPDYLTDRKLSQLLDQGFTRGLAHSLARNNQAFPHRIWVVDNSGSMQKPDGHRIVDTSDASNVKIVSSTRWEEIRECVTYHIRASTLLNAPTTFRLLNNPGPSASQIFSVAEDPSSSKDDERNAMQIMRRTSPNGCTPLTDHILEIQQQVRSMAPELDRTGTRVVVVIATDGLPTDFLAQGGIYERRRFVEAMRGLEGLPCWVVIRLCTDEEDVVDFYNNLDDQLELSLDVLDDFCGEALEVYEHNPWLNYALPLHRCREMGYHHRVFDIIDERALTKSELRDFFEILLGDLDGIPDPSVDWMGFSHEIERLVRKESPQWNPVKKVVTPWVDMSRLNRQYDQSSGCAPCTIL